eukprot:942418-Pyramimonas_sp.AAC.1
MRRVVGACPRDLWRGTPDASRVPAAPSSDDAQACSLIQRGGAMPNGSNVERGASRRLRGSFEGEWGFGDGWG